MNSLHPNTQRNYKGITKAFGFSVMLAGLLLPAERATAGDIELLVPAYANPCCGGGPAMWSTLTTTADTSSVRINIILNPDSGPGASPIDPNYINPSGPDPLLDFKAASGVVYGYVSTDFGIRNINDVKADVDTYYDLAYWRGAGIQVDGIFFDEMSNDLADVSYYQDIRDYVRTKDVTAKVIANPGTAFTANPSGQLTFTVTDYAESADTLVTFENTGHEYRTNYTPPSWLNDYTADHFAHLIHTELVTTDMLNDVDLARSRKAGMVYVTDDAFPNPWDVLASYWDDEVIAIEAHPACDTLTTTDFESPMGKKKKVGSTLPVKFRLFFEDIEISSQQQLNDLLTANGCDASCPEIVIFDVTAVASGLEIELPEDLGNVGQGGDLGTCFRFSGGRWIYNLKLDSSVFDPDHTFLVDVRIDGSLLGPENALFQTK